MDVEPLNGSPLAAMDEVSFAYQPARPVLRGVSLTLHPGERLGLMGPTGSGKSTLLHLLVGLLKPQRGAIEVLGRRCATEADFIHVRRRVGLLFQDADDQLFCPTVGEDVAFGPLNLGLSRAEAVRLVHKTLKDLGLDGYEDRLTYHLSGGEKRLVALAGVLAMTPEVLLLDEPTSGLDEGVMERIANILCGLPQAMILVSHERAFIEGVSTRLAHLRDGCL